MSEFQNYPRITPFLWFESNAEEAADFYVGIFKNSRKLDALKSPGGGPALTVSFELDGQKFTALNGGPHHQFNDAISLVIRCDTQEEIDYYWDKLTADGGSEVQCGWLKDKFGLSWQVTPARIAELVSNPAGFKAMLTMKKLNIAELEGAVAG
ncbi:VOC family protein [Silvibacterium acidisoli]|uniref:VOC family protein n=1 Tax=Acidobacteriaceae bacterium ZG23-2 TaxID=2883246 RepID=UPI00406C67D6